MATEVYDFICRYLREHQKLPTQKIISKELHIGQSKLKAAVQALCSDGKLHPGTCRPVNLAAVVGHRRMPTMGGLHRSRKRRYGETQYY